MEPIDKLIAIEDIKALKARYARAADLHNKNEMLAVFAPDVLFDFTEATVDPATGFNPVAGATAEVKRGREVVVDGIFGSNQGITMVHQLYLPQIEILSETAAQGTWGISDMLRFPQGKLREMRGHGIYYDTYEKIDGEWKIATSRFKRTILDFVWRDDAGTNSESNENSD